MPKQINDLLREKWKERIINQRQSDLTIATWCRQNNFTPHTFYYWQNKFFPKIPIKRDDFQEISEKLNVDTQSRKSGVCLQYQEFYVHLDQQFDRATLIQCLKLLRELS